jgi:uncharacterized protein YtpQ (UPF0354 family)
MDLNSLFTKIRGMTNQTERQDAIRQHVEGLIAALESGSKPSTQNEEASLRPTIKSNITLAALKKAMREQSPSASLPATVPLAGSVVAIVAIDDAKVMRFATDEHVREWKTTPAALLEIGVWNLLAATKDQPELASRANMNFAIYRVGDSYDAARLLVPELRAKMSKLLGAPAAFAIPERDILIAAPAHDADKVRVLREIAAEDFGSAPYPITKEVFVFDDSGAIKVLE